MKKNGIDRLSEAYEAEVAKQNWYAASKLITAMGMFIHDLWAMQGDKEGVYDETAYYDLAADIQRGCDLMEE